MIQYPSTIAEIKQCMFPRRQDGIDCLQVYHAKLTPPKKLKKVKENLGTRVTYCCVDVDCPVRISLKELSKNSQKFWVVYDRAKYPENWEHGPLCEAVVSLSNHVAAYLLKDVDSRGRDLIMKAREQGVNLGGDQALASDLTSRHFKAAARLRQRIDQLQSEMMEDTITQLPAILKVYSESNEGAFADYQEVDNILSRCVIISQISISMYQHGFLRKLFAIDGGFWKHPYGKAYKLLLIESTTGNNENCSVAWAIVDGETTENLLSTLP